MIFTGFVLLYDVSMVCLQRVDLEKRHLIFMLGFRHEMSASVWGWLVVFSQIYCCFRLHLVDLS